MPTEQKSTDQKSETPSEPFPADVAAIRAGSEAFVAAFNKHDAKGVAALWTKDGEYIDDSGRAITGRDAIEQDYAAFFTENPERRNQNGDRLLACDQWRRRNRTGTCGCPATAARCAGSQFLFRGPYQG